MRLAREIIRDKRDGATLSSADIAGLVSGLVAGSVSEAQAAAFAMAVCLKGMDRGETVALTLAMRDSGRVLAWPAGEFPGPVLDKHSTGGIGDLVSLVLAPMLAAAGAYVPMISGRGLGHTGGTLDKLDAIPGYRSRPGLERFRRVVRTAGCAIIGQTDDLAPADRLLYRIRDVTATVESVPLICASILSKKLAAGLGGLVLDVKAGSGAFMADVAAARKLARVLSEVANGAGLPTSALVTDMDEPLAPAAGNAVEVLAAVRYLRGEERPERLHEVVMALGVELLQLGDFAVKSGEAKARLEKVLARGEAAERFARMVKGLGGPGDILERAGAILPAAPVRMVVRARTAGRVASIDTRALGLAVIGLGGGRRVESDAVDPAVGLTDLAGIGRQLARNDPIAVVHARDQASGEAAALAVALAYRTGGMVVGRREDGRGPVLGRIGGKKR